MINFVVFLHQDIEVIQLRQKMGPVTYLLYIFVLGN